MPVSRTRGTKDSVKFMQVLDRAVYLRLKQLAHQRGVTVQELIRVLLIPDWLHGAEEKRFRSHWFPAEGTSFRQPIERLHVGDRSQS